MVVSCHANDRSILLLYRTMYSLRVVLVMELNVLLEQFLHALFEALHMDRHLDRQAKNINTVASKI